MGSSLKPLMPAQRAQHAQHAQQSTAAQVGILRPAEVVTVLASFSMLIQVHWSCKHVCPCCLSKGLSSHCTGQPHLAARSAPPSTRYTAAMWKAGRSIVLLMYSATQNMP